VTDLMDAHTAGRENHAHTLFPLMVFERWASEHLNPHAPSPKPSASARATADKQVP
jgi:hypothetical protein